MSHSSEVLYVWSGGV